ncbi:calcium permeable stress-gated cation channel 1-like [Zingiber officinale]|uniref:calcium permeable stress-gated cation channel 1-like n=1 Tax=Zingiber officinale TaxID=94328 RepID=UPI001C4AAE6B|nr:calcium permeable stress-gated cation channel 1-like [Zingiber officinale]XP_042383042.1 calcium permeable stress-gated cation channel 1-like [Zingiber officinale]
MATIADIGFAAGINFLTALAFLVAFAVLRIQPVNDRVYFSKWYLKGTRSSPPHGGAFVQKFVNLNWRSYLRFLEWVPDALKMPEPELIDHAGLDSVVFLRIYLIGLKIFIPIAILAFGVLVPVNWTSNGLKDSKSLEYSDVDKLSVSNISTGSQRFWTHLVMAYAFTFWTCYVLNKEYDIIASMRLHFLASTKRRPDQFTVLVRNVPPDPDESVDELVEHFFLVNHPDQYLTHQVVYNANTLAKLVKEKKKMVNWQDFYQLRYERNPSTRPTRKTGFLGLCGDKVDAIEYYTSKIDKLSEEETAEREKIVKNPKFVMPVAFVSFRTRWGAAVCAQTQQTRNPTLWLTEWAPEPRDVYWHNLAIPFVHIAIRRLIVTVAVFFLTFFFMIPITFVQTLANIEGIEKAAPFLKPLIEVPVIKSFIQGFLPGIALKIFLIFLPTILMIMSKFEGLVSLSSLQRQSASKYYLFLLVNVFLGSIILGTAFQQLNSFIHQSATEIPKTIGVSIPQKATFFITFIMVDGWAGVAGEILRLKPLIIFHLKNFFLVKTEKDREEAMDPGSIEFSTSEPQIQLYFLLGLVYSAITPFLLPFILVFFALAYVVFRHQIINVYNQEYESAAAFWPDVHGRIIFALVTSQILLLGLLSTKKAAESTPFLIALPILTIWFHRFCKNRYESAFVKYPLQEAMMKDTLEHAREPNLNLKAYLSNTYLHPVFKEDEENDGIFASDEEKDYDNVLVPTKRQSRRNTPIPSKHGRSSPPSDIDIIPLHL